MKKLLSIFLVLILSFSLLCFISCDDKEEYDLELDTPAVAVTKAIDKTKELDCYHASVACNIAMQISVMGQPVSVDIPITMDIKATNTSTESPKLYIEYEMSAFGQAVSSQIYNDSIYTYTFSNGEGTKKANDESAKSYFDSLDELLAQLPSDLFDGLSFEAVEKGYKLSISIPNDMISSEIDASIEQAFEGIAEDLAVSNMIVDITINDDGFIVQLDAGFDMALTIQEMDVTAHASFCATFDSLGSTVTITPPTGYQDFTEV